VGWPVSGPVINGTVTRYQISLCHPLNDTFLAGCSMSSVCSISGNSSVSYGDALVNSSDFAVADNIGSGFSLFLLTKTPCGDKTYRSTIIFACGPHLGAPELTLTQKCQVNFYWRTSAACSVKPKTPEVPCYVIDSEGNKRDLSPLILDKGGYFVNSPKPSEDFIINVCSVISSDKKTEHCPKNSSTCRIVGNEYVSFGTLDSELLYNEEGLTLTYKTDADVLPSGCPLKPKTTVLFKCPSRGFSQPPKLISDSNCQYEVVWETEYACPENLLKGNFKTCQFTAESHGVEINLSSLKNRLYSVKSNDLTFQLSICGGLGQTKCGGKDWHSTSVCMSRNDNSSIIVGTTIGSELKYADGEIILTYVKGEQCTNGGEHSTIISFICDHNATNNGEGEIQHISSYNCTHTFEWPTKLACLKRPLDTPCSVTFSKKTVNLQKLLLMDGDPWEALYKSDTNENKDEYFINVCGQVSKLGNLSGCGEGSSVCVLHSTGEYVNLGNFTSPPIYDTISNSVRLLYTGGSPCNASEKHWESSIDFICRPGHIRSKPILVKIDTVKCRYEFEWYTAEACPEGVIEGADCKVYDNDLGINYDLSSLKSKSYVIDSGQYTFIVGVCQAVEDSPCSSENVGVCQVDKISKKSWKTGEPTSHLAYLDGVINLTYMFGDPYNDQNKTARMTIIIFICDYAAGVSNSNMY